MSELPILGITMGDPAGIGPEITAKVFADPSLHRECRPIVIGDAGAIDGAIGIAGADLQVRPLRRVSEAQFAPHTIEVLDLGNVNLRDLVHGQVSAMCGNAAFESVRATIELAMAGDLDGTVTNPINKESINAAGNHFAGHTEIYAHYTGTERYSMMLAEGEFRVVHVSTHVSLRNACDLVSEQRVFEVIELAHHACVGLGIPEPRIGVAGLNPHCGEGGLFGTEDEEQIAPAVARAASEGRRVEGPIPADTLFPKTKGGMYDIAVAMYHDQGHIPLKLAGFVYDDSAGGWTDVSGVNITLGLPIIRTSVDHGTAFGKAGKGTASERSLRTAISYAARLASSAALR